MTLQEFLAAAPQTLAVFEAASRARIATGDSDFPADRQRVEWDWWREVAAYVAFTEAQELLAHGRTREAVALFERWNFRGGPNEHEARTGR